MIFENIQNYSEKTEIIIAICSCQKNANKRQSLRDTWLKNLPENVAYFFFVGDSENSNFNNIIAEESDVVNIKTYDEYVYLPQKVFKMFRLVYSEFNNFKYVVKCDDDVYLNIDRLISFLEESADYDIISSDNGYYLSQIMLQNIAGSLYTIKYSTLEKLIPYLSDEIDMGSEDAELGNIAKFLKLKIKHTSKIQNAGFFKILKYSDCIDATEFLSPETLRNYHILNTTAQITDIYKVEHTAQSQYKKSIKYFILFDNSLCFIPFHNYICKYYKTNKEIFLWFKDKFTFITNFLAKNYGVHKFKSEDCGKTYHNNEIKLIKTDSDEKWYNLSYIGDISWYKPHTVLFKEQYQDKDLCNFTWFRFRPYDNMYNFQYFIGVEETDFKFKAGTNVYIFSSKNNKFVKYIIMNRIDNRVFLTGNDELIKDEDKYKCLKLRTDTYIDSLWNVQFLELDKNNNKLAKFVLKDKNFPI